MYARYEQYDRTELLGEIKQQLTIDHDDYNDYLTVQISRAMGNLDCDSMLYEKTDVLDIVNNRAKLPCDYWTWFSGNFGETENTVYWNQPYMFARFGFSPYVGYVPFKFFNNGYIQFNSTTETKFFIRYEAVRKESQMYEKYARAIIGFVCWRYGLKNPDLMDATIRNEYRMDWANQKSYLESGDLLNEWNENHNEIYRMATTMLVK